MGFQTLPKAEASRRNGRKGGRPKGAKSKATLEREAVLRAFRERVMGSAHRLFNAQMSIAEGCSFLYRVEETTVKGKKDRKHVLVTDENEIRRYLDGEVEADDYHYITTERPNNLAIADMLNRAFGRPTEVHEHTGEGGGPIVLRWESEA